MEDRFDIFKFEQCSDGGEVFLHENGHVVVLFETKDGYGKQRIPEDADNLVCEQILYYPDTLTVRSKGHFLKRGDVKIGTWSFYGVGGELEREIDHDKDFLVKWEQMLPILDQNDINLEQVKFINRTIAKNGMPQWVFQMESKTRTIDKYVFNASDGSLVEHSITELNPF